MEVNELFEKLRTLCSVRLSNILARGVRDNPGLFENLLKIGIENSSVQHELMKLPHMGAKSMKELKNILRNYPLLELADIPLPGEFGALEVPEHLKTINLLEVVNKVPISTVRLQNNFMVHKENLPHETVFEYLSDLKRDERYKNWSGMGRKSLKDLWDVVEYFRSNEQVEISSLSSDVVSEVNKSELITDVDEALLHLETALGNLSPVKQNVIQNRILIVPPKTLVEIGKIHNVTRERIRQHEVSALNKLKVVMQFSLSKDFYKTFNSFLETVFFLGREFCAEVSVKKTLKEIDPYLRLLITIFYKKIQDDFLTRKFTYSARDKGWYKSKEKSEGLTTVIDKVMNSKWPILAADVARELDIEVDELFGILEASDKLQLVPVPGGAQIIPLNMSVKEQLLIIFKTVGHSLSLEEVTNYCERFFKRKISIAQAGSTLGVLEEALIVDRGVYNTYENLAIPPEELEVVKSGVELFLLQKNEFLSAKVLVDQVEHLSICQETKGKITDYTLLGICQDDDRFVTKRGLMIGLASGEFTGIFKSLEDELEELFIKSGGGPLSTADIVDQLRDKRRLLEPSLQNTLEQSEKYQYVGSQSFVLKKYDVSEVADFDDDIFLDDFDI